MSEQGSTYWHSAVAGRQGLANRLHRIALILQQEHRRWVLWFPVGLGFGIGIYFALPQEPASPSASVVALVCMTIMLWQGRSRSHGFRLACSAALAVSLGFAAAQIRTIMVTAPVIPDRGAFEIEGRVILAEPRRGKQRVLIQVTSIAGLDADRTPARVRITLRQDAPYVRANDSIAVRAMLMPPSGPLLPGGFDFARQAFFAQLGGLGYAIGPTQILRDVEPGRHGFAPINTLRQHIAASAHAAIDSPSAAVATALLTALRGDIDEAVWRDMQLAGLAHLLAISGLHMGLVAGTVFLVIRYGVAAMPALALRWPAKKFAAVTALLATAFYLLLAGATVPTLRAFIMTGIALIAIIADRNPFSMRLVALAATAILVTRPEALLGASFQMSFAAVIALIAYYESRPFARPENDLNDATAGQSQGGRLILLYMAGVAVTTLIASLATAPLGAYHFQRVAIYGIIANLIGVPLTAFWIMPLGLMALLLMPLGLEAPALWLMGLGTDFLLTIAHAVASLPGAGMSAGQMPPLALFFFAFGGLWICLWQHAWRWAGIAFWFAAALAMLAHKPADLVIERSGGLTAIRNAGGAYDLLAWRKDDFTISAWQRALATSTFTPLPEAGSGQQGAYACDEQGCIAHFREHVIAIAKTPEGAIRDCAFATLVIATRAVDSCPPADNPAILIGSRALWLSHGMALRLGGSTVSIKTVADQRGERPWTRTAR